MSPKKIDHRDGCPNLIDRELSRLHNKVDDMAVIQTEQLATMVRIETKMEERHNQDMLSRDSMGSRIGKLENGFVANDKNTFKNTIINNIIVWIGATVGVVIVGYMFKSLFMA